MNERTCPHCAISAGAPETIARETDTYYHIYTQFDVWTCTGCGWTHEEATGSFPEQCAPWMPDPEMQDFDYYSDNYRTYWGPEQS